MTRPVPRVVTPVERRILHAVWSLGRVPGAALGALACPGMPAAGVRARLGGLARSGLLLRRWVPADVSGDWFYELGRRGVRTDTGFAGGWRPPLAQAAHTAAVGASLAGLLAAVPGWSWPPTPPPAAPSPPPWWTVDSWQGEAQLRGWARPGEPFPDARLVLQSDGVRVALLLEVDLGTESRAAWRTKLGRYLSCPLPGVLLAVTTTPARARRLVAEAGALGVAMSATTLDRLVGARNQAGPSAVDQSLETAAPPPVEGKVDLVVFAPFGDGEAALSAVLAQHALARLRGVSSQTRG